MIKPLGLIGDGRFPPKTTTLRERKFLRAIRPRRESQTGWTHGRSASLWRTRTLWPLNEHGLGTERFRDLEDSRLGAWKGEAFKMKLPEGTRTRWVTERIASCGRRLRNHKTK